MASKNSAIWTFFDQVENEPKFAKCKFCGDKLSLGSENSKNQTTTSLKLLFIHENLPKIKFQ